MVVEPASASMEVDLCEQFGVGEGEETALVVVTSVPLDARLVPFHL